MARLPGEARPRTRETYETHLRLYALPQLGRIRLDRIDEDDVVDLIASMRRRGTLGVDACGRR